MCCKPSRLERLSKKVLISKINPFLYRNSSTMAIKRFPKSTSEMEKNDISFVIKRAVYMQMA